MKVLVVDQRNLLAFLIKLLTLSRWNHLALMDDDGNIHENDFGYRVLPHHAYPHKYKQTITVDIHPYELKKRIEKCSRYKYSVLYNLVVIPIIGDIVKKILFKGSDSGNCVWWVAKVARIPSWEDKVPRWFSKRR